MGKLLYAILMTWCIFCLLVFGFVTVVIAPTLASAIFVLALAITICVLAFRFFGQHYDKKRTIHLEVDKK